MSEPTKLDRLLEIRDAQRVQKKDGRTIVHARDLAWEETRNGRQKWYMHPDMVENALNSLLFWIQELPPGGRSGKQRTQGGQVGHVWSGRGYTLIDGVRHDWEEGDVLNFPVRTAGIIVQHFNTDAKAPARILLVEPNEIESLGFDRGCGFEQIEDAPTS